MDRRSRDTLAQQRHGLKWKLQERMRARVWLPFNYTIHGAACETCARLRVDPRWRQLPFWVTCLGRCVSAPPVADTDDPPTVRARLTDRVACVLSGRRLAVIGDKAIFVSCFTHVSSSYIFTPRSFCCYGAVILESHVFGSGTTSDAHRSNGRINYCTCGQ